MFKGASSFESFDIPDIFLKKETPNHLKLEFIRGYSDIAGNIRKSNNYRNLFHRTRIDVLNHKSNWQVGVKLCHILQDHLNIPIQNITWGHPNLGRAWKEHQINIRADYFEQIGFTFEHKQRILLELAEWNRNNYKETPSYSCPCPGVRKIIKIKPKDPKEKSMDKLPNELHRKHFDSYWQICTALGCQKAKSKD
jgi:hypothetical protein